LLVDSVVATFLISGSVTWLYYSDRLMEFPLGVFGVALSTVILPNLSRKYAEQSTQAFSATMDWALRLAVIITIPAAVGLAVLATPILITMFQYRAFLPEDVEMTAFSLSAYALGLPAFIAVKVLAPGFYARQDTRTPVRFAIVSMISNMFLNILFVGILLLVEFKGPHTGLALASTVSAYLNAGMLFQNLRRQGVYRPEPGWTRILFTVSLACAVMAGLLLWQYGAEEQWLLAGAPRRAGMLTALVIGGGLAYLAVLFGAGLRKHDLEKGGV